MENLKVKNFLVIKEADFHVKRINVIIGPQSNGKSVLTKLLYFFKEVMSDIFIKGIENNKTKIELIKDIELLFESYFPKYAWKDNELEIYYNYDDIALQLTRTLKQRKLSIKCCQKFDNIYRQMKKAYLIFQSDEKQQDIHQRAKFYEFRNAYSSSHPELDKYFATSVFIPASRSFFANLQKNIFSFLADNITIDPFLKKFGSRYENVKALYADEYLVRSLLDNEKNTKKKLRYEKVKAIVEQILKGKYIHKDDQDWIKMDNGSINLSNASSGQQESLPMLVICATYPFFWYKTNKTFFIEEPEAHLFPVSQKHITSLIGILYNIKQDFVITTHSPYILTALNNLLLANDKKNSFGEEYLKNIVDSDAVISFDDITAYTIENGKLLSIVDDEQRMIGINIIDSVSDEFNNVFDKLLMIDSSISSEK